MTIKITMGPFYHPPLHKGFLIIPQNKNLISGCVWSVISLLLFPFELFAIEEFPVSVMFPLVAISGCGRVTVMFKNLARPLAHQKLKSNVSLLLDI